MTKSDKVKIGIAGGAFALAIAVFVWYFFLGTPKETPPEPLPEGISAPGSRTPGGRK